MEKNPIPLAPDFQPERRRSRLLPIAAIFVFIPLISPLIVEAASLGYAQWREILGTPVTVRTPILDAIGERIEAGRQELRSDISSSFDRVSWDLRIVLPLIMMAIVIAMMMLRR
jgi:hypothetical protein